LMIETEEDESAKSEKMSKSLGNVYNLEDIAAQGFRPSTLRYLYLGTHYRKQLKFSWANLRTADEALRRLTDFLARVKALEDDHDLRVATKAGPDAIQRRDLAKTPQLQQRLEEAKAQFKGHIAADLNTPAALGTMFELVRVLNTAMDAAEVLSGDAQVIRETFDWFDSVLGILTLRRAEDGRPPVPVAEIEQLIQARRAARSARNFAEADRIRKDLEARGILLEDTAAGTRWKRK
jgi:cysteinyl-tRNA synthetase